VDLSCVLIDALTAPPVVDRASFRQPGEDGPDEGHRVGLVIS
jgi:hypothetical protein